MVSQRLARSPGIYSLAGTLARHSQENQIMTAETARDPENCPAAKAPGPARHLRSKHTSRGTRAHTQAHANPARDAPPVTELLIRATTGDKQAWEALVERYSPLIWSICRRHRLGDADAEDVGQSVWLQLVNHLDTLRDPAALPGWLATTTRRECCRVLRAARGPQAAVQLLDADLLADERTRTAEQEVLAAERRAALYEAFTHLPSSCQQLIGILIEDPPVPYAEISARLGIPVSSIGPTRRRCLDKLRRYPAIAALISAEGGTEQRETHARPTQ